MITKFSLYAFADEAGDTIEMQIAAMVRNALNGIEIRNFGNKSICEHTVEEAKAYRRQLDEAGLTVWSIGSPIGKIDIEKDDFYAHTERFKHTLELAAILGAERMRIFSFFIPSGKDPSSYRNEVIDRLGTLLSLAVGSGVALCHENEKGIYGDIPERCLEIHRALPDMKGIFDPANYIQCGQDPLRAWGMLKEYITYLHIKDAYPDGTVVPAGKGVGHLSEIVSEYYALGGNAATLEPHLTVFSGLAGLEREGNTSSIGHAFVYPNADAAFDAACDAFKTLLKGF